MNRNSDKQYKNMWKEFRMTVFSTIIATIISTALINTVILKLDEKNKNADINYTLESIHIGTTKEWIDHHLGSPMMQYEVDSSRYLNKTEEKNARFHFLTGVYLTDSALLRVFYDPNTDKCEAFIVTCLKDKNRLNIVDSYSEYVQKKALGEFSFEDIPGSPVNIVSGVQQTTGRIAYMEEYYFPTSGYYYHFYYGILDYGTQNSVNQLRTLTRLYSEKLDGESEFYSEFFKYIRRYKPQLVFEDRSEGYPNTYAVANSNVSEAIITEFVSYEEFDSLWLRAPFDEKYYKKHHK